MGMRYPADGNPNQEAHLQGKSLREDWQETRIPKSLNSQPTVPPDFGDSCAEQMRGHQVKSICYSTALALGPGEKPWAWIVESQSIICGPQSTTQQIGFW